MTSTPPVGGILCRTCGSSVLSLDFSFAAFVAFRTRFMNSCTAPSIDWALPYPDLRDPVEPDESWTVW
jgi:hypothetical protein